MPLIFLDNGTHLYYEDTGPSHGRYTTLVFVHGSGVYGGICDRLLPLAKRNGLRIVVINRRDYPGSSPLTDEDVALIRPPSSDRESQATFIRARGIEIAQFLATFVRKYDIPSIGDTGDGKVSGGLVLVGWSSGNSALLGLLGNIDHVPESTRYVLESFIRAYIHFDGPRLSLGLPHLEPFPLPWTDFTISVDERLERFRRWGSSYYQHPYLTRTPHRRSVLSGLTSAIPTNPPPDKMGTFDRMSSEELAGTMSRHAWIHSEEFFLMTDRDVFRRNMRRALFGEDGALVGWKDMRVIFLHCSESFPDAVSSLWEVEEEYARKQQKGDYRGRKMEFHLWRGVNHIPMWDQPEKTIEKFVQVIDGPALALSTRL